MFLGVGDKGDFIGCKTLHENQLNEIHAVRRLCPDAKVEFKRVAIKNNKGEDDFVEVMRVHYRDDKLVETVSGEAFIREGDEKRRLREEEKREIRLNKGQTELETERVPLKYPRDFDPTLLKLYHESYLKKRGLNEDRFTLEDVLAMSDLTDFLYQRHGETIAFVRPDLAVSGTGSLFVAQAVDTRAPSAV